MCLFLGFPGILFSQNIYVSPGGDDNNTGTLNSPKKTIQEAVSQINPGDTLFLREGSYHEEVIMNNINGSSSSPIVLSAFGDEVPVIDGTIDLQEIKVPGTSWELATDVFPGTSTIFKLRIEQDVWQLFAKQPDKMSVPNASGGELADYRLQVVARWPNGRTNPCDPLKRKANSTEALENTWWSFNTTWAYAAGPGTNHTTIKNNPSRYSLVRTGKSFQGGTAILSIVKQGPANTPVQILDHQAGSDVFTHSGIDTGHEIYSPTSSLGPSYVIQHLNALDAPGEWYYDKFTKTVYLWPEDNADPNSKDIRGKTQTYGFNLVDCEYIEFDGLGLFATSLKLDGEHISFLNGAISYPDMPKTMLGVYGSGIPAIDARKCWYFTMRNCIVEYSQYHIIEVKNVGSVFENNYFHHLGMMGMGTTGCFMNINTFRYNTLETIGHRAAVKCNSSPESGRDQSWNLLDGWGFLYANDGVGFQSSQGGSVNSLRSYNWFLRSDKPGHRYDGPEEGKGFPTLGLSHHLVGLRTKSVSTNIKGDYNQVYNYLGIKSTNENGDIAIRWNLDTGEGNRHTVMRNCAADGINVGKWDPLPCINSNNWDASEQGGSMLEFHPDADLLDFRPKAGSPTVNAGYVVPGVTDGFLGPAPDIGAYEWGDDRYWIPGYKTRTTSLPIPGDCEEELPLDRDLIFRHAYLCDMAHVYFGTSSEAVGNASISTARIPGDANIEAGDVVLVSLDSGRNIITPTMLMGNPNEYDPAPYLLPDDPYTVLAANSTYYWRADAVGIDGIPRKGKVWSFSTGNYSHHVDFRVFYEKDGIVKTAVGATAEISNDEFICDSSGSGYGARLFPGVHSYRFHMKGANSVEGTFLLKSDTLIIDTISYLNYNVKVRILDADLQNSLPDVRVLFGERSAVSDSTGSVMLSAIDHGFYSLTAEADGFQPSEGMEVEVYSDTIFTAYLTRIYHEGSFTIIEEASGSPVYRALMSTHIGEADFSDEQGKVAINKLPPGWWVFQIEHEDYFLVRDSLYIAGDTNMTLGIAKKLANVEIVLSDLAGPVQNALITFNGWPATSTAEGMAWFFFVPAREAYAYSVESEGHEYLDDTIYLARDTTLQVHLHAPAGIKTDSPYRILTYPNPATDKIYIESPGVNADVILSNIDGKILSIERMVNGHCVIEVSGLDPGVYILRIKENDPGGSPGLIRRFIKAG